MMRFRRHQEAAKSNTFRLVVLFVLLMVGVVVAVDQSLMLAWRLLMPGWGLPPHFHLTNALVCGGLILGGAVFELSILSEGGGAKLAETLGGREVSESSDSRRRLSHFSSHAAVAESRQGEIERHERERRFFNIVQEMSVAARLPMPRVYVFDGQMGINALTAGWSNADRIIGATEGSIRDLSRDELQGVVAHEFAHILNDDVRINMQLVACVYGLELVHGFGKVLCSGGDPEHQWRFFSRRSDDRERGGGGLALWAGLVLVGVGYLGLLAGKILQSAILRQREYLADASAVEFTRSPSGIGSALRKIAALEGDHANDFEHPRVATVSHLFLAKGLDGWFSSHPSIDRRLSRIFGRSVSSRRRTGPPGG